MERPYERCCSFTCCEHFTFFQYVVHNFRKRRITNDCIIITIIIVSPMTRTYKKANEIGMSLQGFH